MVLGSVEVFGVNYKVVTYCLIFVLLHMRSHVSLDLPRSALPRIDCDRANNCPDLNKNNVLVGDSGSEKYDF